MEIVSILIGLVIGFAIAYVVFQALNKVKNVSKTEYESINSKYNEAVTSQKVSEERAQNLQQENTKLTAKYDAKEIEVIGLNGKVSALEANINNLSDKIDELTESLGTQTNLANSYMNSINSLKENLAEKTAHGNSLHENLNAQKEVNKTQADQINELTETVNKLTGDNGKLNANNTALEEKLKTQKTEIEEIQKTAHLQFEKIANQILEEKSGKFTETNKANIEALLKPLGENIEKFKTKVEEVYTTEAKERFSLGEKVKELIEQTNKVSQEANNLATALKGQSKKQGNWGEVILESILQKSGLAKDREYFIQETIKDEEGNNLRPDVLVKLPDNRIVIIDSKVSLNAYDKFSSSEALEEQKVHLAEHLKSIYGHIDDLSNKKYDNLEASLDFTMMFLPIEPAYLIAIQGDQDLWGYAYSKRILLISPTNLIACLKLISDLWKRELQSKNAMDIVKRGEALYEKFVGFVSSMEEIGKGISKTQNAYDNAVKQLNSGSGNLIGQAQKLKGLGLKSSKEISSNMISDSFDPKDLEDIDL